ncbi:MAG: cupin domain-containing protein [Myxococcales bacterium]|nr:cupin domain-containing protein [Myxococcales bacterium]
MVKIEGEAHFKTEAQRAYHRKLRALHLAEGYSYDADTLRPRPYWPTQPKNDVAPHLWRWQDLHATLREAGELVGLGHHESRDASKLSYDRRVIALTNPGLDDHYAITTTFFADFQLIQKGECTPSHRHTPCATRFIFEGRGWTTVGGERVRFEKGDIVHTGQFPWHDHGNEDDEDLLFLDVLDIPLLQNLGVSHWEFDYWKVSGTREQHSSRPEVSEVDTPLWTRRDLRPRFRPSWTRKPRELAHLRWEQARADLLALAGEPGCPFDGIRCEMANPETGGPLGPTMSVFVQMLRGGETTRAHRHTTQTIYVGVEGKGRVHIDGQTFEWGPKDIFVVPSWAWHHHENVSGSEPAFLQSISDASLIEKIGMYREQTRGEHGGDPAPVDDSGWCDSYRLDRR